MDLTELTDRLDAELRTDDYADLDASANGLQVGPTTPSSERRERESENQGPGNGSQGPESGSQRDENRGGDVQHVAFAVDGVQQTFAQAAAAGADVLVVHHGISWGGFDRVTGRTYDRIAPLIEHDLALYVSHLPLDGHQELGNAAGVADVLELESREPFGELGPEYVGQRGTAAEPYTPDELRERLERDLETGGRDVRVLDFGPETIEDVAVVTGSGTDWLDEAVAAGADALVTGEGKGKVYHEAREAGFSVFLAGHYATETFGVRSLQDLVEGWGLETTYLEVPTGL